MNNNKMAEDDNLDTFAAFAHLLSPLILRALADLGFSRPTLVQKNAIPLALENRDILARARTGSGKTAAYGIPLVQKLLNAKKVGALCVLPCIRFHTRPPFVGRCLRG
jgi:superfamily II DNA/RNA helicase